VGSFPIYTGHVNPNHVPTARKKGTKMSHGNEHGGGTAHVTLLNTGTVTLAGLAASSLIP